MTFKKLKEISKPHHFCFSLDRYFPKSIRDFLRKSSAILALAAFIFSFNSMPLYLGSADGLFFLFIFIFLALSFLNFFYQSMMGGDPRLHWALSGILFATDEIDASKALFETKIGKQIILRCGIYPQEANNFLHDSKRALTIASSMNLAENSTDLPSYLGALYEADKSLQSFLSHHSINKKEFIGAAEWVAHMIEQKLHKERFWARENLGAIPSIGTSWAYGESADLGKFGLALGKTIHVSSLDIENGYREKEVRQLEMILERSAEANAVIIDDDEAVARDIAGRLLKRMELGIAPPPIEHKKIIELDWNSLTASYKNKADLERELLKILNQSVSAGNVILYIRDLSGFVSSVKVLGINLPSLLSPYLSSPSLQIIASTTNSDFHFFIETSATLLERFERIIPDAAGAEATVPVLLEQIPEIEGQSKLFISYPAVLAIANSADRYISYGQMPGKALDMLIEIIPWALNKRLAVLKEADVSNFVAEKTGIETGEISQKESEKITRLEEILHRRIIGQDEAVAGVSDAIRRSRSGVANPKRPLASFLFLGPTGVGKTEVSKALAESFFGEEKKMVRLDMSEYNGPEALSQLIGDFAMSKSGLLAGKVRDNPYSVLLLDEFEKAAPDVLDLFLQILDEGIFTDALGRQANCRNLIIIATSNAGSTMIWDTVKSGKNLAGEKENIINGIIKEKTFRPELLNRFDGIILFHPLQKAHLQEIAKLQLQKLAERLKGQDIELIINDEVVSFLVEKGSDPQFGGRSINRAIQNQIENLIAKKIVGGEVKPGDRLEIRKEELM